MLGKGEIPGATPSARSFGWPLWPLSSLTFHIHERPSSRSVVVLNLAFPIDTANRAVPLLAFGPIASHPNAVSFAIATPIALVYGNLAPNDGVQTIAAFCALAGLLLAARSTAFVVANAHRLGTDHEMHWKPL